MWWILGSSLMPSLDAMFFRHLFELEDAPSFLFCFWASWHSFAVLPTPQLDCFWPYKSLRFSVSLYWEGFLYSLQNSFLKAHWGALWSFPFVFLIILLALPTSKLRNTGSRMDSAGQDYSKLFRLPVSSLAIGDSITPRWRLLAFLNEMDITVRPNIRFFCLWIAH